MIMGESSDIPNSATKVVHPPEDLKAGGGSNNYSLEKFRLFETRARFYLIGNDRNKKIFRVLKIDRSEPLELHVSEDPVVYSSHEVNNLLQRIAEGNRATGGLTFVSKVYGIAGCIRFLDSYYLILITKRKQIGCLCGNAIYSIDESQMITIPHASVQSETAHSKIELRYRKLLSSVDLTKDFFFSYTYPIMKNLQKNVCAASVDQGNAYDNIFVWNSYLSRAIRSKLNNNLWTVALFHGHFNQIRLSVFGRDFSVTLISRRSRHFAGTRYLKRGVNDRGRVANDVETEQIVICDDAGSLQGKMSSIVQMRGSIPLFWSQEASRFSPKPDIILQRYDPTYEATKLHFEDLARRYSDPIIVLNLIKTVEKRPREMMLRREFANAVGYLNQIFPEKNHLKFIHWDFHKFAKSKSANVLAVLGAVAMEALDLTGFFYCGKQVPVSGKSSSTHGDGQQNSGNVCQVQNGVLRTNCIDCLDRTNVAQYAYGLAALGKQLHAMGLTDTPKVGSDSTIATALMVMYQCNGDALAEQYGGSAAHNTVFPDRQGKWKATTQSKEFLKSIKRYYSNTYTDGEKQDAINLFLGYFQPQDGKPALWELDSDYHLHFSATGDDLLPNTCVLDDPKPMRLSPPTSFSPIPACRDDFSRMKLTSFDKLIERTCSSLKNVRFCHDSDQKSRGGSESSGVAPDAAEVQLKSPNWIFGQRKYEDTSASVSHKIGTCEVFDLGSISDVKPYSFSCPCLISPVDYVNESDIFLRHGSTTSVNEVDWYSGLFLSDQDESSDIYKHYADICHGLLTESFHQDIEKERHYEDVLQIGNAISSADDRIVEHEMEAFLNEYLRVGDDLEVFHKVCQPIINVP